MKYEVDDPTPVVESTLPGASNKQLDFLTSLLQQREIPEDALDAISQRLYEQINLNEEHGDCAPPGDKPGLTKRRASEFISRLLEQPHRLPTPTKKRDIVGEQHSRGKSKLTIPSPDELPSGRYAIKNDDGELRFYKFWRGDRNPNWVSLSIQHSDDFTEIGSGLRLPTSAMAIINKIAEDSGKAARMYGRHFKTCSECGRGLTNRISRLLDIGPICGGHHYDETIWDQMRAEARAALEAAGLDPNAVVEDTDDLDSIRERARLG